MKFYQVIKFLRETDGNFKHATIVENKIPGCIVYFQKEIITNIYLIREQIILNEEKDILEIFNIIKNSFTKNSFL